MCACVWGAASFTIAAAPSKWPHFNVNFWWFMWKEVQQPPHHPFGWTYFGYFLVCSLRFVLFKLRFEGFQWICHRLFTFVVRNYFFVYFFSLVYFDISSCESILSTFMCQENKLQQFVCRRECTLSTIKN